MLRISFYLLVADAVLANQFSEPPSEKSLLKTASPDHDKNTSKLVFRTSIGDEAARNVYLDTVRDSLTGAILPTPSVIAGEGEAVEQQRRLQQRRPFDANSRWRGEDWCDDCFTMAGGARVQNVRDLVTTTIAEQIPGDFLEAGTWRGGCSIMARVVQKLLDEGAERRTYLCDSFRSSQGHDSDAWEKLHFLKVSQDEVESNMKQFVEVDDNVQFRKGYFFESLPKVRKELQEQGRQLAVLRGMYMHGDMYASFMDILYNLYELIPVGGYFICDDCNGFNSAQQAIDDFRKQNGITEVVTTINDKGGMGTFWRKESPTVVSYSVYLDWNKTRVM
jgi:O-methyltransferase